MNFMAIIIIDNQHYAPLTTKVVFKLVLIDLRLCYVGGWLMTEGFGRRNYDNNMNCFKEIPMRNGSYLILNILYYVSMLICVSLARYAVIVLQYYASFIT